MKILNHFGFMFLKLMISVLIFGRRHVVNSVSIKTMILCIKNIANTYLLSFNLKWKLKNS